MKRTVLDMVQDILSSMDSDEVNSINDTLEAQQVYRVIRQVYDDIITTRNWPHLSKITQLIALGDLDKPTHMLMPDSIQYIEWIKYNKRDSISGQEKLTDITYKTPKQFLDILSSRNSEGSNVQLVYDDGVNVGPLIIQTNKHPDYWTTFDDEYVVFDSIDNSISGQQTLTSERVVCQAYVEPLFVDLSDTNVDTFIPDLPAKIFPYLYAEAKSVASIEVNQSANEKAEQQARRQRTWQARNKRRQNKGQRYPDYGRKSARVSGSSSVQTTNISVTDPDYLP